MAVDKLTAEEIEVIAPQSKPAYEVGRAYQWVLTQGWVVVGFFVGHGHTPFELRCVHLNYYRSAGNQTHAQLAQNGGNEATEFEYSGNGFINFGQIIYCVEYNGEVPRQARVRA